MSTWRPTNNPFLSSTLFSWLRVLFFPFLFVFTMYRGSSVHPTSRQSPLCQSASCGITIDGTRRSLAAGADTRGLGVDVSFSQRGLTIVGILNQQRQRLNIPCIDAPPPSAPLPMVSSSSSTPLPPRTRLKSSATGGPQPSKQSCQNRTSSNNPPPDLLSLSGLSTASGSQPRKSNTSSSKSRARAPQPPSPSTLSNANATLPSTPRHLEKLKSSQRSSSLPPSSNSTRPSHSKDDNVPPTPNQQGKIKQSPAQSTPRPQPRNVRRDPGLINAVWRELQVNKSTALDAERLAILETEARC
jgi:hypothetical protein